MMKRGPIFTPLARSRNVARLALEAACDNLRTAASLAPAGEAERLEAALDHTRDAYRALAASQDALTTTTDDDTEDA